jgi:hypothetical protein
MDLLRAQGFSVLDLLQDMDGRDRVVRALAVG